MNFGVRGQNGLKVNNDRRKRSTKVVAPFSLIVTTDKRLDQRNNTSNNAKLERVSCTVLAVEHRATAGNAFDHA